MIRCWLAAMAALVALGITAAGADAIVRVIPAPLKTCPNPKAPAGAKPEKGGLDPGQLAAAYGITSLWARGFQGQGRSVALIEPRNGARAQPRKAVGLLRAVSEDPPGPDQGNGSQAGRRGQPRPGRRPVAGAARACVPDRERDQGGDRRVDGQADPGRAQPPSTPAAAWSMRSRCRSGTVRRRSQWPKGEPRNRRCGSRPASVSPCSPPAATAARPRHSTPMAGRCALGIPSTSASVRSCPD